MRGYRRIEQPVSCKEIEGARKGGWKLWALQGKALSDVEYGIGKEAISTSTIYCDNLHTCLGHLERFCSSN